MIAASSGQTITATTDIGEIDVVRTIAADKRWRWAYDDLGTLHVFDVPGTAAAIMRSFTGAKLNERTGNSDTPKTDGHAPDGEVADAREQAECATGLPDSDNTMPDGEEQHAGDGESVG
jgi:hypothetical protein